MQAEDITMLRLKDRNNWKIGDPDKPCGTAVIYAVCPERNCYVVAKIKAAPAEDDPDCVWAKHNISYPSFWSEVKNILRNYVLREYDVLDIGEIMTEPREMLSRAVNDYLLLYNERRDGK
jgi:hypothetical protein